MKKLTWLLAAIVVIVFCLSLCACGFVSYVKYDETEAEDIFDALNEYLDRLHALSKEEYYREDERRAFLTAMLDAENELRECKTHAELEKVFVRHAEAIGAIPTDLDLTIAYLTECLNELISMELYRETEQKLIEQMIVEYAEKLQGIANALEGEKLLLEFKTLVSDIKTDEKYDAEEVVALKREYDSFGDDIAYDLYPTTDHESLYQLVKDFKAELETITSVYEGNALLTEYNGKISGILTLDQRLERDRKEWSQEWRARLESFAAKYSLNVNDAVDDCIASIATQDNAEAAARKAAAFILSYADGLGAKAIEDMRSAAHIYVNNIAALGDYRDEQRQELGEIADKYCKDINSAANIETLLAITESAEGEARAISTNDELWKKADGDFAAYMQTKYADCALVPPKRLDRAADIDELARIIDYYAFYQLDGESFERGTFRVQLDFSHKYSDYVIKDVYWYCELIRSAVGITGYFETDTSMLVITLVPYDLASKSNTDEPVQIKRYDSLIEYTSSSILTDRAEDFDDFPYYEKYAGRYIKVWNSQQLWYALEHEYIPLPVEGSAAERVLERAKEILRDIIKDGMTIEEKVFAIYSWYADNVAYDHDYTDYLLVEDRKNFPDSLVAELNSFHAEGALFDGYAVCCSYAKSALIMMRIEGIEAYRVILHDYASNGIDNLGRSGYGSHAIIALRASDGKFYYCDVEQSAAGPDIITYEKYHQLLVTADQQCPYNRTIDRIWNHLDYATEFPVDLFWGNITYNGKRTLVKSEQELIDILDEFMKQSDGTMQINIFGYENSDFSIMDFLDANENFTYHLCADRGGFEEYAIIVS